MVRLLGILVGATIAVGIFIVVIGVPEFADEPQSAIELGSPGQEIELPAESELPDAPETEEELVSTPEPEPAVAAEPAAAPEPLPAPESDTRRPSADNWYAFWSPFRSEFAANGFVSQLQKTTGLDYRVVKQDIGVYEVAFAYSDDDDVEAKLALIAAATGLDLPGG